MRNTFLPFNLEPAFLQYKKRVSASFDPTEVSGVLAIYDSSDLSTLWKDAAGTDPVTSDGDPVRRRDDTSGNGHHIIAPSDTTRWTYYTSGGLHWLESDGVDDRMEVATRFSLSANPELEVSQAIRPLSNIDVADRLWQLGGTGTGIIGGSIGTGGWAYRHNNGNRIFDTTVSLGTDVVAQWTREASDTYGEQLLFLDGVSQAETSNTNGTGTPIDVVDQFNLANTPSATTPANFRDYGTVVSSGATAEDIANLLTYLAAKQGRVL